jgi:cell division septum initiation protein DivIVA
MTDKEFKRLSRPQLIEIIYQLQLKLEEQTAENEKLSKELADKRLRIDDAGNIAEAALSIHNVFAAAQDAAAHYIEEVQIRVDSEYKRILQETDKKAAAIIEKAHQEAAEIVGQAKRENPGYDPVLEAILKEYRHGR